MSDIRSLTNFKFKAKNKIEDWSLLIEKILENIQYEHNFDYKSCSDSGKKYYLLRNPFGDGEVMSCILHAESGNMRIFNTCLPLVKRKEKMVRESSITISETCRLLNSLQSNKGNSMNDYIDFILQENEIPVSIFNEYKRKLTEEITHNTQSFNDRKGGFDRVLQSKGFYEFRRFMFVNYIADSDILSVKRKMKNVVEQKFKRELKPVEEKTKPQIIPANPFSKMIIQKYLAKRGIAEHDLIQPVEILWKGGAYRSNGIKIMYPNGFEKIRVLDNKTMRYFSNGSYDAFFEFRNTKTTDTLYLVEGEFEAITMSYYIQDDVFAMHNVNSLPQDLSSLKSYKNIQIRIDYDEGETYDENAENILRKLADNGITNAEIHPKLIYKDKKVDYNYLHQLSLLESSWIINPQETQYIESISESTKKRTLQKQKLIV